MAFSVLGREDTQHTADTVEWARDGPRLLACGTYQLDEASQRREGRLLLFRVPPGREWPPEPLAATPVRAGVLDCSWLPGGERLVTADADGHATVLSVPTNTDADAGIVESGRAHVCDGLLLSVDVPAGGDGVQAAASDSQGHVCLLDLAAGPRLLHRWAAHEFEAWAAAGSPHGPRLIASGGDDSRLRLWDPRQPSAAAASARLDMGVTCAAWHPRDERLLASGAYDEVARVWDARALRQPLSECALGGGVWRLRWGRGPGPDRLLAAAMHAGVRVARLDAGGRGAEQEARYDGHGSLAYGVDWAPAEEAGVLLGASCSFYDRALHFWTLRTGGE